MIQANELRIGNWYDHNGSYRQVTPNTIEEVWEGERIYVNPIPLTPEILEKCGFEKYDRFLYRLKNGWHWISVDTNSLYIHGKQVVLIDYLHQLQNLYFALTGKELNVQL